eukprot:3801349-Alexandrium_andersonii.AAC.2
MGPARGGGGSAGGSAGDCSKSLEVAASCLQAACGAVVCLQPYSTRVRRWPKDDGPLAATAADATPSARA